MPPCLKSGLSGLDPDISGGLTFEDKNFMGMGQQLSVLLSKKEADVRLGNSDSKLSSR